MIAVVADKDLMRRLCDLLPLLDVRNELQELLNLNMLRTVGIILREDPAHVMMIHLKPQVFERIPQLLHIELPVIVAIVLSELDLRLTGELLEGDNLSDEMEELGQIEPAVARHIIRTHNARDLILRPNAQLELL